MRLLSISFVVALGLISAAGFTQVNLKDLGLGRLQSDFESFQG